MMQLNITAAGARTLFIGSIILTLAGLYFLLFHNMLNQKLFKGNRLSFERRVIIVSALLLVSTWMMRYMVCSSVVPLHGDYVPLSNVEEFFNSLIHTLQSFSLDESYEEFFVGGKVLMTQLYPREPFMVTLYSLYASIQNVLCPIAGGAILLTILASVFPRVKLWFLSLQRWRPICYFSELNDASLALATSIRNGSGKFKKALIVFTDVYTDSKDEDISERIQKAKGIASVCLKDDISTIPISGRKGKMFFLMDMNVIGNLRTLTCFTEKKRYKKLTKADQIYYFGQDDSAQLVLGNVRDMLYCSMGKEKAPEILPVNGYQHLVYLLLKNKPLFSGVDRNREKKKLDLTIFGSGLIGTEMFLAAYWCGQILNFQLRITLVSNEKEETFRSRINHINPDILNSAKEGHEILRVYPDSEETADEYFIFDYLETNIREDDMLTKIREYRKDRRIVDSDYFVVALGSDEDNYETADMLSRIVTVEHLKDEKAGSEYRPVVAFVIYDDELNKALAYRSAACSYTVDMVPFGSLSETYDYYTAIHEGVKEAAEGIRDAYENEIAERISSEEARKKLARDYYSQCSDIARAYHIQYKAFSVGLDTETFKQEVKKPGSELAKDNELAWLEHRRWNAFMRTKGFRAPTAEEERAYIRRLPDVISDDNSNLGKHKELQLKLHPAIVECDHNGMKASVIEPHDGTDDLLDKASIRMYTDYSSKNIGGMDFKMYDYPSYEFKS